MKKIISSALLLSVFMVSLVSFTSYVPQAQAAVSDWQKGASIFPYSTTDYGSASFQQSLRDLRATGANYVSLVVPIYQSNDQSSDIHPGWDTPTDESLISAINFAHSIGLKVMLKPHLASYTGSWRAYINASDRNAWFRNYGNFLNHLGDIGKQTGVEGICIGTELISMTSTSVNPDNTQRWNAVIGDLRSHFPGFLTYSANWGSGDFAEEVPRVAFWGALDYIGISGYYPLAEGQWNPSVEALMASWDHWNNTKVRPISEQYGKKVIFTEIGYRSADNAHNDPFDAGRGGNVNLQEQANDYQALFQYWNNYSYIAGVQLWNWESDSNYGGAGNNHYSPQNKPAEEVMKQWFSGTQSPANPTNPTNPPTGAWTVSGSSSGNQVGSPVTFTTNISNSGQASGVLVDLEVYNQSGNKIEQKFFENQTLSSNAQQYQIAFTPSSQEQYTFKVGLFNHNWTTNYYWGNEVSTVSVGQTTPTNPTNPTTPTNPTNPTTPTNPNPGPSTFTTNIWWPTDGATVIGSQPFKAMVEGKSVLEYSMYWQVDGDRLNEMYNSDQDYPHKEVVVDVTGWNWKGSGPYVLNFISKDSAGNIISQKSTTISVQ